MKKGLKRALLPWVIGAALFCFFSPGVGNAAGIDSRLYSELLKFHTDGKVVQVDGVPCLKIFLRKGQSISYFCRFVEYFDRAFKFYRQRIALINRMEFMAELGGTGNLSTNATFIYVPLNFSIRPQILPERIGNISNLPKFILIDLAQKCLGLYHYGRLIHQFPICSGTNGTPAKKFVILSKEKDHYSTLYDNAWMPYALRLFSNYYLHAGILPGYSASHGCIRLIYENAIVIYNWAQVGTPGEIIKGASNRKTIQPQPRKPPSPNSLELAYPELFIPEY